MKFVERLTLTSALTLAAMTAGLGLEARPTSAQPKDGPDIVKALNDFFAGEASADAKETLGWTKLPEPITVGDPVDDHVPLDTNSEGVRPPAADLVGASMAQSGPLDDATFTALFSTDGLLAEGAPMVHYPQRYQIDVNGFRQGMLITVIVPREPYGSDPDFDVFIVAVEGFDARYPAPTTPPFVGINKSWRYEITATGSDVDYRQFDGTQFPAYQTETIVLDTCSGAAPAGGAGKAVRPHGDLVTSSDRLPCFFAFFTAAGRVELEGVERMGVELFVQQGSDRVTDRNGSGFGEPFVFPGALTPGALGFIARDPVVQPGEGVDDGESPSEFGDDDAADPAVASPTDEGGGGGGIPVGPAIVVGVGAAATATGVVIRRSRRAPRSMLGYSETAAKPRYDDAATRERWASLLRDEGALQQRLLMQYTRVAEPLATELRSLAGAMVTFQDGFGEVLFEARQLQLASDENQASMNVTKKIDLVLGVADAGRTVWSFGTWGWTKLFGATDEVADAATDVAAATSRGTAYGNAELAIANAKIAESPELLEIANAAGMVTITTHVHWTKFNRGLDAIFSEAAVLADRAGTDFVQAAKSRVNVAMSAGDLENGIVALWVDMAEAAAQAKGFVKATEETRELLTTVTTNARTYCNGGVVGSFEELRGVVDGFAGVAAQPGFLDTAPNLYTIVGGAGSGLSGLGRGDTALELLYSADDIAFMRWLSGAIDQGHGFDELPALWQATMGPIAKAGDEIAQGVTHASGAATVYSLAQGLNSTMSLFTPYTTPVTVSSILPDASTYVAQYGILRPTFLGFEAGDDLGWTLLFNGLNSVGGFSTWLNGMRASLEADLLYTGGPPIIGDLAAFVLPEGASGNLMDDVQPTLRTMAGASLDIVNSLQRIAERVQVSQIGIDDRLALQSLLGDMEATVIGASPTVRTDLEPQLDERRAHITAKLRQLDSVQATLVNASNELPAIALALDQQVSTARTSIQWADPALLQGFALASNIANVVGAGVLRPPVATDPPK